MKLVSYTPYKANSPLGFKRGSFRPATPGHAAIVRETYKRYCEIPKRVSSRLKKR